MRRELSIEEEGILKAWMKKMLMKVTTMTAKIMASSQSSHTLCFSPSLYSFFQKAHLTFLVMKMSKITSSPNNHQ